MTGRVTSILRSGAASLARAGEIGIGPLTRGPLPCRAGVPDGRTRRGQRKVVNTWSRSRPNHAESDQVPWTAEMLEESLAPSYSLSFVLEELGLLEREGGVLSKKGGPRSIRQNCATTSHTSTLSKVMKSGLGPFRAISPPAWAVASLSKKTIEYPWSPSGDSLQ